MKHLILISLMTLLINCGDVYILQVEDLEGIWHGSTKVESQIDPGAYKYPSVTISIQDRDTSIYSTMDTFNIEIQDDSTGTLTHFGYITDLEEEYGSTLHGNFHKIKLGGTSDIAISFTQISEDSLQIEFSEYEFKVRD